VTWKDLDPFVGATVALLVIFAVYAVVSGTVQFWRVAMGVDGRASTSKFQALVWTVVVLFAYLAVLIARLHVADLTVLPAIPQNVLIALGLSLTTSVAAAGITTNRIAEGKSQRIAGGTGASGLGALVKTDAGSLDLGKSQLLVWTLVAVAIYLLSTSQVVATTLAAASAADLPKTLPDIDPTLMILTGLGQAAYLGNKFVSSSQVETPHADPGGSSFTSEPKVVSVVAPEQPRAVTPNP
jgi:hypothetical protein